jgi:hypothetical protein
MCLGLDAIAGTLACPPHAHYPEGSTTKAACCSPFPILTVLDASNMQTINLREGTHPGIFSANALLYSTALSEASYRL